MKKAISLAILIICLFVIYQYGVTFFKEEHSISYTIRNNSYVFSVDETYKNGIYYFHIQTGDYIFYISQKNTFNKMRQVIENMEILEGNNHEACIYPIFKNKEATGITCSDGKTIYSYESSKNGKDFLNLLHEKGIQTSLVSNMVETEQKKGAVTYYPSAMDEIVTLWTYRGFSVFSKERSLNESTLSFDRYDNTLSMMVGKYYITPLYIDNRLYEFNSVEVFDVTNNNHDTIELGTTLSNYTYVSGVVEDKLYLFDKNTLQQVEINPKSKSAKTVASGNENAIYYFNGDWQTRNIYDFVQSKIIFQSFDDTELKKRYTYSEIYNSIDSYYIYDGNHLYQVYKDFLDIPVLLFEQTGMKNIQIQDNYIYYVLGNTLYKYQIEEGRKRLMQYDEFYYNASNLYSIYRN